MYVFWLYGQMAHLINLARTDGQRRRSKLITYHKPSQYRRTRLTYASNKSMTMPQLNRMKMNWARQLHYCLKQITVKTHNFTIYRQTYIYTYICTLVILALVLGYIFTHILNQIRVYVYRLYFV